LSLGKSVQESADAMSVTSFPRLPSELTFRNAIHRALDEIQLTHKTVESTRNGAQLQSLGAVIVPGRNISSRMLHIDTGIRDGPRLVQLTIRGRVLWTWNLWVRIRNR
jgi:hypothetical protein